MAVTEPFRLRVLKALTAELEKITPANGFHYDITGKVRRGIDRFSYNSPVPMVSILESISERENLQPQRGGATKAVPWEILIQGWAEDDPDNPTDPAHYLLADVRQRLAEISLRRHGYYILDMAGGVDSIHTSTGVVRPADEVSDKAYFWLQVTLNIIEDTSDPYDRKPH